ncbi:hypothetical protein TNIN_362181 [Trichonephila inaurata madagascariensis]|uniref:Uncharacterized protein n=1 Tax=Trichonephila inaurata madagascariensis TaxID=2747483 RepID=A0A8X7CC91_9ARAC|nr:hypothetical protein TNIN_362181 [Trichonephila inaurata madagascariensis]
MPFNDFVTVHLASIVRTLIPPCDRINRLRRLKLNYDCGEASSAHQQRISDTNPLHNEKVRKSTATKVFSLHGGKVIPSKSRWGC